MLNKLLPLFSKKSGFYFYNEFSASLLDNQSQTCINFSAPFNALELIDIEAKALKFADFKNVYQGSANDTNHYISAKDLEFCTLAMAKKDVRYYLQGVCLNLKTHAMVGTDGHRLHFAGALPTTKDKENEIILPAFFVNAVLKVLKVKKQECINLYVSENKKQAFCNLGDMTIACNTIDGVFPDVSRVIPKKYEERGAYSPFKKQDLTLLKKVVKTSKHNAVIFEKNKTLLNGDNSELVAHILPCITLDSFKMGFNFDYLFEINSYFEYGDWQALNENSVLMVNKNHLTALLMPLRLC